MRRRGAWSCALALALASAGVLAASCVPSLEGNEPREPNKETPGSFGVANDAGNADAGPPARRVAQQTWNEFFASPELRSLIEGALRDNRELNIQLQELVIAKAEISARQGEYLPRVSAGGGAGLEKVPKHTPQGASDEAHGLPEPLASFTFGLTGSWEVDIWKKLRNAAKAARLRYLATVEARNFMITQLVAEIARSYWELVALDNILDALKRNVEILTDALEVVKLQKLAARTTELAVQRFEAEVLKTKSRLYDLEQERVQAENRINFLVGRYPQPVRRNPEELKEPLPASLVAGLPSDLLRNRPDVRKAELELEAAKLDVKAARAAFYPSLSIDAEAGYRAFNAEHLVATPESLVLGLTGNLTAPLLNRKAIEAQFRSANARQLQAVFAYEQTLLLAFTDVRNQLAAIENLRRTSELQAEQVETLHRSVEVSSVLFQSARADYMEVLLTRRDSLEAEISWIETKKRQRLALVALYQALGGGWR
jgi:NodT family efflux transporter outer membrane factor (OMF) lipoprotein